MPIEEKIEVYLGENLPGADPGMRVPVPMLRECEVCVIIPSFGEREYILKPLESLARQVNVGPEQYEVIVVVNNPASAPHGVVMDNRETLRMLRYIKGETYGEDIRLSPGEEEVVRKIRRSAMRLYVIDLASPGKTLPDAEANVGGARNRGAVEAVERFYKHTGKNGIIAHTDADSCVDENYIRNLITVFAENPQWIAVSGRIFEVVNTREDIGKMREFNNSIMQIYYYNLLKNLFINSLSADNVTFYGCNAASRAFEIAVAGGVPRIPGAEDTLLGQRLEEIGEVGFAPDVVVYAAVRYSSRTSNGRGRVLIEYREEMNEKGTVEVRSLEAEFLVRDLVRKLLEAVKDRQISPGHLGPIMTINNEPIFKHGDLVLLSRYIQGFRQGEPSDRTAGGYETYLKPIYDKIGAAVENKVKPICIKAALSSLVQVYCLVDKIKKEYHCVKRRMIQEINEYAQVLEDVLDEIFADKRRNPREPGLLTDRIVSILERNRMSTVTRILENRCFIHHMAELIAAAPTKQDAGEMLQVNYSEKLVLPQKGTLEYTSLELRSLHKAVEDTELDQPVFRLITAENP
jgi:GT2 family glycosyltransferase